MVHNVDSVPSNLNMETARSSETSVSIYSNVQCRDSLLRSENQMMFYFCYKHMNRIRCIKTRAFEIIDTLEV